MTKPVLAPGSARSVEDAGDAAPRVSSQPGPRLPPPPRGATAAEGPLASMSLTPSAAGRGAAQGVGRAAPHSRAAERSLGGELNTRGRRGEGSPPPPAPPRPAQAGGGFCLRVGGEGSLGPASPHPTASAPPGSGEPGTGSPPDPVGGGWPRGRGKGRAARRGASGLGPRPDCGARRSTPASPGWGAPAPTPPPREGRPGPARRPQGWPRAAGPASSSPGPRAPSPHACPPCRAEQGHENSGKNNVACKVLQLAERGRQAVLLLLVPPGMK